MPLYHHLSLKGCRILFFAGRTVKRFLRLSARYPHFFCLTAGFIRFGGQSLVICRDLRVFEGCFLHIEGRRFSFTLCDDRFITISRDPA